MLKLYVSYLYDAKILFSCVSSFSIDFLHAAMCYHTSFGIHVGRVGAYLR